MARASMDRMLDDLLDLVLPPRCPGCGSNGHRLCPACTCLLSGPALTVRTRPPRTWAIAEYKGPIRTLIVAHKERGRSTLTRPLGTALATAVLQIHGPELPLQPRCPPRRAPGLVPTVQSPTEPAYSRVETPGAGVRAWVLVPVPSGRQAVRRRGVDATLRLAEVAAEVLRDGGVDVRCVRALRQVRGTGDQGGLSVGQRTANMAGAMRLTVPVQGSRVLLVDDVITTGSSLAEARRALVGAGAEVVGAVVVGWTRRG